MAFSDLSEEERQLMAEHERREHEARMQDPEFRQGWDRMTDLIRRANERDEAVTRAEHAEATIARSRAALATFESRGVNNFDIPSPAEIRDAWRASLTKPEEAP